MGTFYDLLKNVDGPGNARPVYIDGQYHRSIFTASFETDITFCWLAKKLARSGGAPIKINGHCIVSENWILTHPNEELKDYNYECNGNTSKRN